MTGFSVNERVEQVMGRRLTPEQEQTGVVSMDTPAECGYRCPVCDNEPLVDGNFDGRLQWSEYAGFLWCSVCDFDYPTPLCWNVTVGTRSDAVDIFLRVVRRAQRRAVQRALTDPDTAAEFLSGTG